MRKPSFRRALIAVTLICAALTAAHFAYAAHAYRNASVIQFIAREIW